MGSACQRCGTSVASTSLFCPHCGATSSGPKCGLWSSEQFPSIPGYTVLEAVGSGGSSVVYRSRQNNLGREVAIKMIRHEVDDPKEWRRFEREARIIASLSGQAHVVTIFDVGQTAAGRPFLVTELLDCGSLSDVLTLGGPAGTTAALQVGCSIAEALTAAHDRGILHRDVKPGNVLVGSAGQIKLADFGIARLFAARANTTTSQIAFTLAHAAPELLRGEEEGPASDVYGLASTVVTALTGQPPFARRPGERIDAVMWRKLSELPPPLPPSVPPALATILNRCLASTPADRPTLAGLSTELHRLSASGAVAASSVARQEPTRSTSRDVIRGGPPGALPGASSAEVLEFQRTIQGSSPGRSRHNETTFWLAVVAAAALVVAAVAFITFHKSRSAASLSRTLPTAAIPTAPTSVALPLPAVSTPVGDADASGQMNRGATNLPSSTSTLATTAISPAAVAPTSSADTAPIAQSTNPTKIATAPATVPPANAPTAGDVTTPAMISEPEAIAFVRTYYDEVAAGDYITSWPKLAAEFATSRNLTLDRYSNYWRNTTLVLDQLTFAPGPGDDHARVRFNATYTTAGHTVAEADQLTLRRADDGTLVVTDQRRLS